MILIDGRRQTHDLGPWRVISPLSVSEKHFRPMPEGQTWANSRMYLFGTSEEKRSRIAREQVQLNCAVCGSSFMAVNATLARTCGQTCRQRARRATHVRPSRAKRRENAA